MSSTVFAIVPAVLVSCLQLLSRPMCSELFRFMVYIRSTWRADTTQMKMTISALRSAHKFVRLLRSVHSCRLSLTQCSSERWIHFRIFVTFSTSSHSFAFPLSTRICLCRICSTVPTVPCLRVYVVGHAAPLFLLCNMWSKFPQEPDALPHLSHAVYVNFGSISSYHVCTALLHRNTSLS